MPELPEVESVKLQLKKYLIGHAIENVEIRYPKCFEGDETKLKKAKIKDVRRFGKVIAIDLSNDWSITIHIKLTGQLIYRGPNLKNPPAISKKVIDGLGGKHTLVIFDLDKDGRLYYNDFRRFGWIKVMKTDDVEKTGFVEKLGPEPLKDLNFENFAQILSKTKRGIKVLLMDQSKIAGVGNIYANDALWLAQIHPETPANAISTDKAKELFKAIETVLKSGLEYGGASELSFVTPDGAEGEYQRHFLAYGRDGDVCTRCNKAKFEKSRVGGRGTYFCPVCQKKVTTASKSLF